MMASSGADPALAKAEPVARLGPSGFDPSRTHDMKCWPEFFSAIVQGEKKHELRRNDRNFRVGDALRLREFDPDRQAYTGQEITVRITYSTQDDNPCALSAFGLQKGFCILSIAPAQGIEAQRAADSEAGAVACDETVAKPRAKNPSGRT